MQKAQLKHPNFTDTAELGCSHRLVLPVKEFFFFFRSTHRVGAYGSKYISFNELYYAAGCCGPAEVDCAHSPGLLGKVHNARILMNSSKLPQMTWDTFVPSVELEGLTGPSPSPCYFETQSTYPSIGLWIPTLDIWMAEGNFFSWEADRWLWSLSRALVGCLDARKQLLPQIIILTWASHSICDIVPETCVVEPKGSPTSSSPQKRSLLSTMTTYANFMPSFKKVRSA